MKIIQNFVSMLTTSMWPKKLYLNINQSLSVSVEARKLRGRNFRAQTWCKVLNLSWRWFKESVLRCLHRRHWVWFPQSRIVIYLCLFGRIHILVIRAFNHCRIKNVSNFSALDHVPRYFPSCSDGIIWKRREPGILEGVVALRAVQLWLWSARVPYEWIWTEYG